VLDQDRWYAAKKLVLPKGIELPKNLVLSLALLGLLSS